MAVIGGYTAQGYTTNGASFYAFRHGGITSLGFIPMGSDNSGATQDRKKIVSVTGKFDGATLQTDRVPVTYERITNGKTQKFQAVWRSVNGKFVLESGDLSRNLF